MEKWEGCQVKANCLASKKIRTQAKEERKASEKLHKKTRHLDFGNFDKRASNYQNVLNSAIIEITRAAISTILSASHA